MAAPGTATGSTAQHDPVRHGRDADNVRLCLGGDVMTGRGIDQILPHPVDPRLYEPYVRDARAYVNLAESANGPIPAPVSFDYVWGDALGVLGARAPDLRIANLETAITARGQPWPGKGIHYRMHPAHVPCLSSAALDCCVLANNHVLDWGQAGLADTLATLDAAGIATAGAGADAHGAGAAAILSAGPTRVLVFACGHPDSGIPPAWSAAAARPGVHLLEDWSEAQIERLAALIGAVRRPGDLIVVSIHWGGNWGYQVAVHHRRFAHALVDRAGVHLVHGHSSHHPRGVEVYRGRLILYGCGDLLNDYEGIEGHEAFRPSLALLYFADLARADGALQRLEMVPLRIVRMRLTHAGAADRRWLAATLARESSLLDTGVASTGGSIVVESRGHGTRTL